VFATNLLNLSGLVDLLLIILALSAVCSTVLRQYFVFALEVCVLEAFFGAETTTAWAATRFAILLSLVLQETNMFFLYSLD